MKPSRLSLPRSATVNIILAPTQPHTWRCWVLAHRRQGVKEKVNAQRTHNATPRHAGLAGAGWSRTPHVAGRSSTYELARIAENKNDLTCYYCNKNAILFTITRCTTVDFACDVHVVRSSISRLSKCLSVLIRALSRQSADSPARPRIAFAHDDDDDAHNSSRRKSAVLPDHCSILHPQVPSTILAPRRPLCRPNVTTLACPRRTGRRGGYIFSQRHDWMSA